MLPQWVPDTGLTVIQDERRMARFAQYAMVASEEALEDAGWSPKDEKDLEATVQTRPYSDYPISDSTLGCVHGLRHW
jgi:hypothetical protein